MRRSTFPAVHLHSCQRIFQVLELHFRNPRGCGICVTNRSFIFSLSRVKKYVGHRSDVCVLLNPLTASINLSVILIPYYYFTEVFFKCLLYFRNFETFIRLWYAFYVVQALLLMRFQKCRYTKNAL